LLLAAAQFGKEELVAEHIAQGADLAACDGRGRTALLLASKGGHLAAVQLLLKAGADIAAKTKVSLKRETLTRPFADLHVACMRTCGV
jgi:ankyrin repeat protein